MAPSAQAIVQLPQPVQRDSSIFMIFLRTIYPSLVFTF
jgi:hypothetical protein